MSPRASLLALLLAALPAVAVRAQADLYACRALPDAGERLACYDRLSDRLLADQINHTGPLTPSTPSDAEHGGPTLASKLARETIVSTLAERWELGAANKRGVFRFSPHEQVYFLPLRWSSNPNRYPASPSQTLPRDYAPSVDDVEAKFQLSFKTKLGENLLGDNGDLWFGYTQQSNWQLYNSANSAPFRDTNYEPELIFTLATDTSVLGLDWHLLNFALVHQSNGRSEPVSRSWNRIVLTLGGETPGFALLLRPWFRIEEPAQDDDNRDIEDYVGRGEVIAIWTTPDKQVLSLQGRHSLRGGEASRGSLRADWSFPLVGQLRGYLQVFSGYGENLLDYNIRQNTLGIGVSLSDRL